MATRHVLTELGDAAVNAGHPRMQLESVGGVDATRRVSDGEQFELVFLDLIAMKLLSALGHVEADSITPLVLSQVAVAVPSGSDAPARHAEGFAFKNEAEMRVSLQRASRVGYSTGPSGTALVNMIEDWGLSDELGERLIQAKPGTPVARLLERGDVDLGFQQLSELVGQPGVRILGVLPSDCAIETVFAGAVAATASDAGGARELLAFLAADEARPVKAAHSFAPVHR